jgi:hypothetical protein
VCSAGRLNVAPARRILAFGVAMAYCKRPANGDWATFIATRPADAQSLCTSTFWHGMVHVLGNVANVILFCSDLPTLGAAWCAPRPSHVHPRGQQVVLASPPRAEVHAHKLTLVLLDLTF